MSCHECIMNIPVRLFPDQTMYEKCILDCTEYAHVVYSNLTQVYILKTVLTDNILMK